MDFVEARAFSKVVATRNMETGRWSLFGIAGELAIMMEKARGGAREWSSLDRLADFCEKMGLKRWEIHSQAAERAQIKN